MDTFLSLLYGYIDISTMIDWTFLHFGSVHAADPPPPVCLGLTYEPDSEQNKVSSFPSHQKHVILLKSFPLTACPVHSLHSPNFPDVTVTLLLTDTEQNIFRGTHKSD